MLDRPEESEHPKKCREILRGQLTKGNFTPPVLPHAATKVLMLTNDPEANLSELSELIHSDQSLATYVLKVANSAAYNTGTPIVALQQAITLLGLRMLGDIAVAISVQAIQNVPKAYSKMNEAFMQHALISGIYGKEVARMRRRNVEGQFLCGLLHGIGRSVTLKACAEIAEKESLLLKGNEMDVLIEDFHTHVSMILSFEWKLPSLIQVTSAYYNRYDKAPQFREETAMTYLSGRLATLVVYPDALSPEGFKEDGVFEELNLYPDEVDALVEKQPEILEQVKLLQVK